MNQKLAKTNRFIVTGTEVINGKEVPVREQYPLPWRKFIFEVVYRNNQGVTSAPARLLVDNPAPDRINIAQLTISRAADDTVLIVFPDSHLSDFAGHRIWASQTDGFTPGAENDDTTTPITVAPIYEGSANPVLLKLPSAGTWFLRCAVIDVFSHEALDCNISNDQRQI
jgi:hypothetical protein